MCPSFSQEFLTPFTNIFCVTVDINKCTMGVSYSTKGASVDCFAFGQLHGSLVSPRESYIIVWSKKKQALYTAKKACILPMHK